MRILWNSPAPWARTGYGVQTGLFAPRIKSLGHDLVVSAPYSFAGGPLDWGGLLVLPQGQDTYGNDIIAGHYAYHDADIVITLCDVFMLDPNMLAPLNVAHWHPVDSTPVSYMDRVRLQATGSRPIAMSRYGEQELRKAGFDPLYVPHGVDTAVFRQMGKRDEIRRAMGIAPGTFVIGMNVTNRDAVRKGISEQMAAFARFRKEHPDSLLLVHTQSNAASLGALNLHLLTADLGISDAVRYCDQYAYLSGMIDSDAMAHWYNSLDLYSGCTYGEGFGVPVIEAQACGVPVLLTDCSALTELCGSGWLVQGEQFWVPNHQAWWKRPFIRDIADGYERAYWERNRSTWPDWQEKARQFALKYDADYVLDEYWRPVLAALEADLPPRSTGEAGMGIVVESDGLRWHVDSAGSTGDRLGPEHEQMVTDYVLDLIPENGVLLDVGAHVGHYTLRAAARGAQVIAVEANPDTANQLVANLDLNGLPAVVHRIAAWDSVTAVNLSSSAAFPRDGSTRVIAGEGGNVPAMPLDSLLDGEPVIDVIKLDVEGADLHALRGLRQTLARHHPVLFIEDHSIYGYYQLSELLDLLAELGYAHEPGPMHGTAPYWVARPKEINVAVA